METSNLANEYAQINKIVQVYNKNLIKRSFLLANLSKSEFPKLINPLREIIETIDQQGNLIQPNQPIQTSEVSEEVVQTSALPGNINENTGLTRVEEALLSPSEKAIRLRQRGARV